MRRNRLPWKEIIDSIMFLLLLNQMAYVLTGQRHHEWTGTTMVFLVLCHNLLNRRWFGMIRKGQYNSRRLFGTVLNFFMLVVLAGLLVSGVVMSRYVFAFLPIHGGRALARRVHISCAYWGFLLMAAHIGMHWNGIKRRMGNRFGRAETEGKKRWLLPVIGWAASAYGMYAFYRHEIVLFLFLQNEFAIFNEQSIIIFALDYLTMVFLMVNVTDHFIHRKRKGHKT